MARAFSDKIGNTHGMRFSTIPPSTANNSTTGNQRFSSFAAGDGAFEMADGWVELNRMLRQILFQDLNFSLYLKTYK
jgi:hypothetical protein